MKRNIIFCLSVSIWICNISVAQISEPQGELLLEDSITLMPLHEWVTIPSPAENVWQVGKADKSYLDSSLSIKTVIVTDTINNYPPITDDYFLISIPEYENYGQWPEAIFSFYHRYETDSLMDGGFVEISYDGGDSWENVFYDRGHVHENFIGLYSSSDTIVGGIPAYSGSSNDWIYTEFHWIWLALVKKSEKLTEYRPMLKFRFVSDSVDLGKNGWLINNIVFRGYDVSGSVNEHFNSEISLFPNPFSDFLQLKVNRITDGSFLKVYSIQGKLQLAIEIRNNSLIDVSSLPPGLYYFSIIHDNQIFESGKLIKN